MFLVTKSLDLFTKSWQEHPLGFHFVGVSFLYSIRQIKVWTKRFQSDR